MGFIGFNKINKFDNIITIEDNAIKGGFGSSILEFSQENNFKDITIKTIGIPDVFVEHGTSDELYKSISIDNINLKTIISESL